MKNINIRIVVIVLTITAFSCKKFVSIAPPIDKIGADKVFTSDEMATAAIRGLYATIASGGFAAGGPTGVGLLAGRSADEYTNFYSANELRKQFADNNILSTNTTLQSGLWTSPYQIIYASNTIIENLQSSSQVSAATKQQLLAEAKFIRALSYFYLTNLFGEVPLILSTDYRVNAIASAIAQSEIYAQIINDLEESKAGVSDNYPTADRTRVNKWAAIALLARVYLYTKDYAKAEAYASEVIGKTDRYNLVLDDLNKVFLKNSQEAILQFFVPAALNLNTYDGATLILTAAPGATTEVTLNENLYAAFAAGDQRLTKWIGVFTSGSSKWYFAYKYKVKTGAAPLTEYNTVLRVGEQYLIRSESRINQGKIDLGIADLNKIRTRARAIPSATVPDPLPDLPAGMSKADALLAVENERRVELFSEWGHRWLDLKRTGRVNTIIGTLKGINWQMTDQLYPIPNSELLNNSNLKQNPGYN